MYYYLLEVIINIVAVTLEFLSEFITYMFLFRIILNREIVGVSGIFS